MNALPLNQTAELDVRNRAVGYMRDAQQQLAVQEQQQSQKQASEFQQMLWLKHFDQSHAIQLRDLEHRHALELEERKQNAALELRRLELENQRRNQGMGALEKTAEQRKSFWQSKLFFFMLTIALPLILPPLIRALSREENSRRKRRWGSGRNGRRREARRRRIWRKRIGLLGASRSGAKT